MILSGTLRTLAVAFAILTAALSPRIIFGQQAEAAGAAPVNPLASKQEMIRDRFDRFMDRVYRLQEQLAADEPQNAERLARVLERSGELGLAEQLDEIIRLLRESPSLAQALGAQASWVDDADRLLAILLQRESDNDERRRRISDIEEYRQRLKDIIEGQQSLREDTAQTAARQSGDAEASAEGTSEADSSSGDDGAEGGESQVKQDIGSQAQSQAEIADQTNALAEKMRQDAGASNGQQSGKSQGQGQSSSSQPGLNSLDQAQQDMNDAVQRLRGQDPAGAGQSQDRALEDLRQAERELDEALNQLRKEDREEALRNLESRFREMLADQQAINAATIKLYEIGRLAFTRVETLQLAELASRQNGNAEKASQCAHVLDEEGTTIVFPHVVGQVAEDMATAGAHLAAVNVGPITQEIQAGIVETLEQLLESITRMQQENEQQPGIAMGQDQTPPLLPPSAELKLLRSSQVRINSRTQAVKTARDEGAEAPETISRLLSAAAQRQQQCAEIAREMRDRQMRQ